MKHSVLMIVGQNLIYQCNPEPKPVQGNPELMKDYAYWQQNTKNYLVKDDDKQDFSAYISDDNSKGEMPIPHALIEIYFDVRNNRNYVRMNKGVKVDEKTLKVASIEKVCKVCLNIQDVPVEQVANYFPICDSCLSKINISINPPKD